jgi:4a-hydroxytetrahydrobiopterin dehydratase
MSIAAMAPVEIAARLAAELPGWRLEDGAIRRDYRTADWRSAMLLAGAIGHLAEAAWHHPDLAISWGRVSVALTTHDAGGVSARDFALAARIEQLAMWRPGEEAGALTGVPASAPYITG